MNRLQIVVLSGLVLGANPACVSQSRHLEQSMVEVSRADERPLAEGLRYSRADRSGRGGRPNWLLSFGVSRNDGELAAAKRCAENAGLPPRTLPFVFAGVDKTPYAEIVAGEFPSRIEAQEYLNAHRPGPSCAVKVKAAGMYPSDNAAPTVVHVLKLTPSQFRGKLIAARGSANGAGLAMPSELMRRHGALAATNGGFFVMEPSDGIVGESAGISLLEGMFQSEPTAGRPWIEISNGQPLRVRIQAEVPEQQPGLIASDGHRVRLDGLNRKLGYLRNCGALLDKSHALPWHDVTCNPRSEIVAVTPGSGVPTTLLKDQAGYLLTAQGNLVPSELNGPAGSAKAVLLASGDRRAELDDLARSGRSFRIDIGFADTRGRLGNTYAVNGGPTLLAGGKPTLVADIQGWPFFAADLKQANAIHEFISLRAPRTAVGLTAAGDILLVVVDGWRYRSDAPPPIPMNGGATISELTDILRDLGAVEALNLDGGGSSTMALATGVVSHPSDPNGERPVGDSLLLMPAYQQR